MDLSDKWKKSSAIQRLNIYPFMLESATSNGHVYGVPYDYNTELIYYDRDWFAQRGVAEPRENWTVDEHMQIARKLTDPQKGVYGEYNQIKRGRYESIQWMENWSGQGWLSQDNRRVAVNTPENIESIQYWYDLERQYSAAPFPGSFKPRGNLQGGGYAMWIGWISNAFTFTNPPAYDWGMALFPKGLAGQKNFAQGHMFSIYAGSPKKDAAWQVIEWMASFEGQQSIIKAASRQPMAPNNRLWDMYFESLPTDKSRYVKDWMYNVIYGKNYVNTFSYWDTYGQMETVMAKAMDNIFNKQLSLKNEMDDAARQLQVILDSTQ
jgi:multiple sugar transport system substrate-binding protein